MPEDADSPRFRTNVGSVHYAPEKSAIIWKIKQFGGSKEFLMRAELGLPSVKGDDEHGGGMTGGFGGSMGGANAGGKGKRPISVKFEIPYFTTSGIQVRYLKIIEPKVSYLTFLRVLLMLLPLLLRGGAVASAGCMVGWAKQIVGCVGSSTIFPWYSSWHFPVASESFLHSNALIPTLWKLVRSFPFSFSALLVFGWLSSSFIAKWLFGSFPA